MKKVYEAPEMLTLNVESADCISASGILETTFDNDGPLVGVEEIL